ncbi:MAG: bifunctional adenosylcobinamide kinase/adenosylcobinamide-phosphate guanylyltransferase [Oscillospiraceae bacterium]|jgi:adenosylcobinamide kinase/adenosylcobinamide-phosphate guanylyltransferase|nr:bifunctional adenosylcobinamide kinase/adenosylcobinamide-phosphate guanylyltransferase [Oscillospiraceae bacterium]
MAKITFITGGTGGKSRWAITNYAPFDNVLYMVVSDELDEDTAKRIDYSCKEHNIEWDIRLSADNLAKMVEGRKFSILDDLSAFVKRVVAGKCPNLDEMNHKLRREIERESIKEIEELMNAVRSSNGNLTIISTEIGFCPVPNDEEQRWFREILGNVNQRIANLCNEVHLSTSGVTFKIKG